MPVCNKFIVVEGPDGAGKSILCKSLQEHFKWPIVHGGGPLTSRHDFLDRNRTKGWSELEPKICDRVSYISERVYAKDPLVSSFETQVWLNKIKPIVIFCCLERSEDMVVRISNVSKPHKSAEQLERVKQDHAEITRKYKFVMGGITHIHYNWLKADFRNLLYRINEVIF